ncbi:hypothetical protein HHK36_005121 [Tetracentron sinense]|uniref:Uncharacterized protein n=1 Tax=Tetracentron sinense TaxID=13715 RepID=A0A834ZK98_TETSI|nr:hypothetical protein HHK36_005121 [Tetracentron sinense]
MLWRDHYLELNLGNLRQKHSKEVSDAVIARHGHVNKARPTDIQCKIRIDTLKKNFTDVVRAGISSPDSMCLCLEYGE